MTKTATLNKIFNNKLLKYFIPLVNPIITFLNNRSRVWTKYDRSNNFWIHTENKKIIRIDTDPCWNVSYKTMEKAVRSICCKKYFPNAGDVVVDLGAGVGSETVLFQRLVGGTGVVFAIEAHPKTASFLKMLCEKNNYKNVIVSQNAIGGSSKFVYIENKNHHVSNKINEFQERGIRVSMTTLDQFVRDKNLKKINFMKINIEGAEADAIKGMNHSIKIIENIAVSCHDFLEADSNDRIRKTIIDFLLKNDFEVEESKDRHYIRRSWIYAKNRSPQ